MKTPKFLIADNSDFPDEIFVLHTEYPRFLLNVITEDVEWLDDISPKEAEENKDVLVKLVEDAFKFYDEEMEKYLTDDAD